MVRLEVQALPGFGHVVKVLITNSSNNSGVVVARALARAGHDALRWQGPLDVEWKIDPRSGEPWLIEINPRFSGAIGFPIALGVNMATLCVAASAAARLPEVSLSEYPAGVGYVNPGPYLRSLPARLSLDGVAATLGQLRGDLRGRVVMPAWEISDPAPLLGKCLRGLGRMVSTPP
jgi:hypothetical protein